MSRLLTLSCALLASIAMAQMPTVNRRPEVEHVDPVAPSPCCAAAIVPAGNFEVETNYSGDAQGTTFNLIHGSNLILKYSATDRLQFQIATNNFLVWGDTLGGHVFDGISLGGKYIFLEEEETRPIVATSFHVMFPTDTRDTAMQQTLDLAAWLYVGKTFGNLAFDGTLTANAFDITGDPAPRGGASLTATWNFNSTWGVSAGPWGYFSQVGRVPVDGGFWASLNINPLPQIAFIVGAEAGFFPQSRAFSVFAGVAFVPTSLIGTALARLQNPSPASSMVAAR